MKSPIICPAALRVWVKTSLGRSIAAALKRSISVCLWVACTMKPKYADRKTYIGAMPGRIIKSLIKAGSSNPVFILDEIDKVSADRQGRPSSALLEVLDRAEYYVSLTNPLDVDYDLSKVMFIATANNLSHDSRTLLDRRATEVSGYITEKIEIAVAIWFPKSWKQTV